MGRGHRGYFKDFEPQKAAWKRSGMSKERSYAPWCSSRINHVGFPLHTREEAHKSCKSGWAVAGPAADKFFTQRDLARQLEKQGDAEPIRSLRSRRFDAERHTRISGPTPMSPRRPQRSPPLLPSQPRRLRRPPLIPPTQSCVHSNITQRVTHSVTRLALCYRCVT